MQDQRGSYSARLSTAGMTAELVRDGHWEVSCQTGDNMAILGKDQRCLLETLSGLSPRAEGMFILHDQKKTLKEKKGCCHSLLTRQSKLNPTAALRAACAVNPPLPRAMQHERGVFWTRRVGSGNSNHRFLLGLHYIRSTLPTVMQPDQTFTRLLTRIIRNFLCTLFFLIRY